MNQRRSYATLQQVADLAGVSIATASPGLNGLHVTEDSLKRVQAAMCLGARGVFIGRPYLYGLAANGELGVKAVLDIFTEEMQRAMILMGCGAVADLDRSWLFDRREATAEG